MDLLQPTNENLTMNESLPLIEKPLVPLIERPLFWVILFLGVLLIIWVYFRLKRSTSVVTVIEGKALLEENIKLKEENEKLIKDNEDLKKEATKSIRESEVFEEESRKFREENEKLIKDNEDLKSKIKEATNSIDSLIKAQRTITDSGEKHREEKQELTKQISEYKNSIDNLNKENIKLKEENIDLKTRLGSTDTTINELKEKEKQLQNVSANYIKSSKENEEIKVLLSNLQKEKIRIEDERNNLQNEKEALLVEIENLKKYIKDYHIQDYEIKINALPKTVQEIIRNRFNETEARAIYSEMNSQYDSTYDGWRYLENTHALWVLNPLFKEMKRIVRDEDAKKYNSVPYYTSKDVLDMLIRISNELKKDRFFIDALEMIRKRTG